MNPCVSIKTLLTSCGRYKKRCMLIVLLNRVEKVISEQGFEVRRMRKEDIKRFLALYFDASLNGEQMPDIDGEQFFEVDEDDEEA